MKKRLPFFLLFFSFIQFAQSQDSLRFKTKLAYESKSLHVLGGSGAELINPVGLKTVADNPFNHFAIYGGLKVRSDYRDKYRLELGVFFEERNHSAGNNRVQHLITFPKITFTVIDSFQLKNQEFKTYHLAGDLWSPEFNDLLRIHNVDFHGFISKLGYKRFWLAFYKVSDLSHNTGVGLHEMSKISLEYISPSITNAFSFSINDIDYQEGRGYNIENYFEYRLKVGHKLKAHWSWRIHPDLPASTALAALSEWKWKNILFILGLQYYQSDFNVGFVDVGKINYRGNYGDFIGEQLYPLKNYFRPFNQWAHFTSFQESNVFNLESRFQYETAIYKTLHFFIDLDVNILHTSRANIWLAYPFYNTGLSLHLLKTFQFEFSATNKHMNLDLSYQTFSPSKKPFFAISIKVDSDK